MEGASPVIFPNVEINSISETLRPVPTLSTPSTLDVKAAAFTQAAVLIMA